MKGEHSSEWLSLAAYHIMANNKNSAHWTEVCLCAFVWNALDGRNNRFVNICETHCLFVMVALEEE